MAKSNDDVPRIMLIGKTSSASDTTKIKQILANMEPNDIPKELIHSIMITTDDGNVFNVAEVKQDISYSNIEQYIHRLKIKGRVKLVEILINLDLVKQALEIKSNTILDKVFKS